MTPIRLAIALFLAISLQAQVATRSDDIQQQRVHKRARLWPEHTSGIVERLNKVTERGFLEGRSSGKGTNGFQLLLGGMRSGQGQTVGTGYRRGDLWGERLGFRVGARGTVRKAYMFDFGIDSPRLRLKKSEVQFYVKYENSPRMDYYGPGPNSRKADRTSFRLEDTALDLKWRYQLWRQFFVGGQIGAYFPNTGPGQRGGVPSTDQVFSPAVTPGLDQQTNFTRAGGLLQYDYRDLPTGPRSGGNYYAEVLRYWDNDLDRHTFTQLESVVEQYLPYWNKTRVVALRLATVMTWAADGQSVPFYLQPYLGGSRSLRGFNNYRFYDQNSIFAAAEHRWHIFSGGHGALFFEMGKVAPKASQLNFHELEYSGGIGFRFTLNKAVFMRIDNAFSREGYRFIWTFSQW